MSGRVLAKNLPYLYSGVGGGQAAGPKGSQHIENVALVVKIDLIWCWEQYSNFFFENLACESEKAFFPMMASLL